jgi:peptidoglycan/LPS O-acetylase OafA/YrhL
MKYRPEVDGLRALAVLPVVFFHAHFPFFDGGFIGVDVFFVISGYLITSILVEEIAERRFSLANFYERRARRILPALFLVIASSALAAPLFLDPTQFEDFGKSVAAVMFFVSNIFFWLQSGYFGTASETSPLLHTWSLAVEEQFYVLFPLLLLLIWRYARHHLWLIFGLLTFLSLGLAEWGWRNAAVGNFYLLPSRGWELLIGGIVALAFRRDWFSVVPRQLRSLVSIASLVALSATFVLFDENTPHPSLITLIPVLATAGIIATASPDNPVGRFLSLKPLVTIGLLSYSYYLWHQPIFAFIKLSAPERFLPGLLFALTFVSLGIAYCSWKYCEQPFRNRNRTSRKKIFQFSAAGTVALTTVGIASAVFNESIFARIYPKRFANYQIVKEATENADDTTVNRDCHIWARKFTEDFREQFRSCSEKYGKAVFITGGSHGRDLYNAVARNSNYPFIASISRGYCRAHPMLGRKPPYKCHYNDLLQFAAQNANRLSSIIYTQTPDKLFATPFDKAQPEDLSITSIDQVVDYLDRLMNTSGVPVYIVGMLPILNRPPASLSLSEPIPEQLSALVSDKNIELTRYVDSVFAKIAAERSIPYIPKINAMDLDLRRDLFVDQKITYSDSRHLSTHGQKVLGKRLVDYLVRKEFFPPALEVP